MAKKGPDHLGKRIKKLRAFNGMTQEELAAAINKTRSMVSHIERTGEAHPHTLQEIARVLGLPVEELESDGSFGLPRSGESGSEITPEQPLIAQLRAENHFLKETISNQWKLLFELAK